MADNNLLNFMSGMMLDVQKLTMPDNSVINAIVGF